MSKVLIFITKRFPFGKGEDFIGNEIDVLCAHFEKCYLITSSSYRNDEKTKMVPNNVNLIRINLIASRWRYSFYAFKSIFYILSKELFLEILSEGKSLKKIAGILLYYSKMRTIEKKIIRVINDMEITEEDSIVIYSYWFNDTAQIACRLRAKIGKKCKNTSVVSRAHGYDLYPDRNIAGIIPFRRYCLENIDSVFPCSEVGTSFLKKEYPEQSKKIKTAYLGTKDYGIGQCSNDGIFRIVTCSELSPLKRVEIVARAIAYLEEKGVENLEWVCIGSGAMEKEIQNYVKNNVHKNKVVFKGYLTNQEVINFYINNPVDVFINTSISEGLPVSIMEAQSFGTPVIATDVGGTREIVIDGETGYLLKKDCEVDELAYFILKSKEISLDGYFELRYNCKRIWLEKFEAIKNYKEFSINLRGEI